MHFRGTAFSHQFTESSTERSALRVIIRFLAPLTLLLALLVPLGAATAAPATSSRSETFIGTVNGCNGELIELEGIFHVVTKEQKDGSFLFHITIHGQGTGSDGNKYVLQLNEKFLSTSSDVTDVQRVRLISQGSAPNEVQIARTEDGEFTFEMECRG
jgi:hypothetical protein